MVTQGFVFLQSRLFHKTASYVSTFLLSGTFVSFVNRILKYTFCHKSHVVRQRSCYDQNKPINTICLVFESLSCLVSQTHEVRVVWRTRSVWPPERRLVLEPCPQSPSLGYKLQVQVSESGLWAGCDAPAWKKQVYVVDTHLDLCSCTRRVPASWLNPPTVLLCCSFWTWCSSHWLACLVLEGPWVGGGCTCLGQVLRRCFCSVSASPLCTTGVSVGGCTVGLVQGCRLQVQVSGLAALVDRKRFKPSLPYVSQSVGSSQKPPVFSYNRWPIVFRSCINNSCRTGVCLLSQMNHFKCAA